MKYFGIYRYLLCLMNQGVPSYSVYEVMKAIKSIDDDDVEEASRILEEHGIVKSDGYRRYVFLGEIELMRNFILRKRTRIFPSENEEKNKDLTLDGITSHRWSLVNNDESCGDFKKDYRNDDNDEDDDDENPFLNMLKSIENDDDSGMPPFERPRGLSRRRAEWLEKTIKTFISKKANYNDEDDTFSPHTRLSLPDGTPFVIKYEVKNDNHFFSDNGLLKQCLHNIMSVLPRHVVEPEIDRILRNLANDTAMKYIDGGVYSDLSCASDEEELNSEIGYFVKEFDCFFDKFYETYSNKDSDDIEMLIIDHHSTKLICDVEGRNYRDSDRTPEEHAIELLIDISNIHDNIKRVKAVDITNELVKTAREQNKEESLTVFNKLLEMLERISDFEFNFFKSAVKEQR